MSHSMTPGSTRWCATASSAPTATRWRATPNRWCSTPPRWAPPLVDTLIGVRPELASVLPEAPPVNIELPTAGLSWLGRLRNLAQRVSIILGAAAALGVILSLFVAKNRPAILRRVSIWAFGASAFWLVVGYGVPFLAETVAPSSTAIIAAMIDVFFGAMIRPAILMGAFGGLLLVASMLWGSVSQRRGAAILQPARRGTNADRTGPGRGGVSSNVRPPGQAVADRTPTGQTRVVRPATGQEPSLRPMTPPPSPVPARVDATQVFPTVAAQPPSTHRWVEGVGYVEGSPDEGASPR